MLCLIVAESAIFTIFVIAYLVYIGKSLAGPTPSQVLDTPLFITICLWSSSFTFWLSERALRKFSVGGFILWMATTIILGLIFLAGTGLEWHRLIFQDGLTVSTNLFGTTFYSLVGLHATHVIIGLLMLIATLIFAIAGKLKPVHAHRIEILGLYWHFVDAVWVVVFTVVYIIGK